MESQYNIGMSNNYDEDDDPYFSLLPKITIDTNVIDDFCRIPITKKRKLLSWKNLC